MNQISVAKQFSRYPAGRFETDGPFSGEYFRKRFLTPALREHVKIAINLDGARGYGSSFLEEAFGGLVRQGFSLSDIEQLVTLISSDPSLIDEIWEYVRDEAARVRHA